MSIHVNGLIVLMLVILYFITVLMMRIIGNKFSSLEEIYTRNNKRLATVLSLVDHSFEGTFDSLREIKEIKQNLIMEDLEQHLQSKELIKIEKIEIRKLKSISKTRRKEACTYLGLIGSENARMALESALMHEKDYSVKIYISNALTDIRNPKSIEVMTKALIGTHKWYRTKAISNILEFGYLVQPYLLALYETNDIELIELNLKYAAENFNEDTKRYLFRFVDDYETKYKALKAYYLEQIKSNKTKYRISYLDEDFNKLLTLSCKTLSNYYFIDFSEAKYYENDHVIIKNNAFWALSKVNRTEHFKILLAHLNEADFEKTLIAVITKMIEHNPRFLYILEESFFAESNMDIKKRMAQIFSNKIEYYILKLNSKHPHYAKEILGEIILNGKINELIGFMNLNRDFDLENMLIEILKERVDPESQIGLELRRYLNRRIIEKWGTEPFELNKISEVHLKDKKLAKVVLMFTLIGFLAYPLLFFIKYSNEIGVVGTRLFLKKYVIGFNYILAYYSVAINISYLILMCFSYANVRKQAKLWNFKNISMLFRHKMIPSISIIAPAFNEEKSIVSSVRSLLNLKYPDYELIVVNDGSNDETLRRLIEAFKLIRVDYQYQISLDTVPIRGIYRNASLPKLVVIDKNNGGKADALNAGINVANKEFFCGIDADSLLEPESLLRLASLTIDESKETPALGGNVCPINSCKVDQGLITEVVLSKNILARFQTIEYIRAFMAGRLGWQQMNSLLIISGAFGLFRKDRVISVGGYLTTRGKYKKDTVGEDMEIVVRISRMMREINHSYKILYAFNANCWTEVPEDLKSLKNQRFRWHRGLIDILYFHRKMMFNRRYGSTGIFVLPYYLIFEAFGPMIEMQGYVMVVLAAILGILDEKIALLLFITTILLGVLVSITALLIAEREEHYYRFMDVMKMLFYAILENFGVRQLVSFWRIEGQFNLMLGQSGWGKIKRKGIES
ncbi:glycosyltransferase [Fusibacter ferrireducens]|uniref:Glycosyltransferase n=1 Tax=Fusibacter ferrireducens TaxID=2785058 RepID=A0ABR9ZPG4_9FIRM|nr:glycosyltransferase [Fusibacter ferrireducens]MBF4692362.1 glycosyltransferase [Fusibacter ferrireducens]